MLDLKKGITVDGINWIIKFPQETSTFSNVDISFTTAPLSEYIGSHVYDILGYKVHNTKFGICNNELINIKQLGFEPIKLSRQKCYIISRW